MLTLNDELPSTNTIANNKSDQNLIELKYNNDEAAVAEQRRHDSATPIHIDQFNEEHVDDHDEHFGILLLLNHLKT
jgi:hypothetical protein